MQKIDIKEIPTSPGIYIFKDEYEEPLYVGKAKNLRKRVPSYFREKSSWKIKRLVAESKDLSFVVSKNVHLVVVVLIIDYFQDGFFDFRSFPIFNIMCHGRVTLIVTKIKF